MVEYLLAMFDLFNTGLDDGHTTYCTINSCLGDDFQYPGVSQQMLPGTGSYFTISSLARIQMHPSIRATRSGIVQTDDHGIIRPEEADQVECEGGQKNETIPAGNLRGADSQ